jgi:hypothetical protein
MANIAGCMHLTTWHSAVWRECARRTALAPLAPDQIHCSACQSTPARRRSRRPAAA